jgi:hypothetical protein
MAVLKHLQFFLQLSTEPTRRKLVDVAAGDWLRANRWNPHHDTVVLIHGYGGQDGSFPMATLRDGKWSDTACAARNP